MKLADLLSERQIRVAIIVDDACDEVPMAADLRSARDEWSIFFDDLQDHQRALLQIRYPDIFERERDGLMVDDKFVAAVWAERSNLGEIAEAVFAEYNSNQEADLRYVDLARSQLEKLGIRTKLCGRVFAEAAKTADLIVIDLYLGASQDGLALTDSMKLLAEAMEPRTANPPLVILMSRNQSLEDKRDEFRDTVGLVESGFRILTKSDLHDDARLATQLERLADNAIETRRLAAFFAALNLGAREASRQALTLMRKLKLSDIGQVQQMVLEAEGAPTGSYLVDVFDRVFQHELEGQNEIISAAQELNKFAISEHPPPYVAGSPELQDLVQRTLAQHAHRLALPGSVACNLAFGDVLKLHLSEAKESKSHPASDVTDGSVLLVVTPACDLQRRAAQRVLLMVGSPEPVNAQTWSRRSEGRTSAILIGGELYCIQWDLKHVFTLTWSQLEAGIFEGSLDIVARLRETHALELQQRVLSGLGRIGLLSPMPATFTVDIEAYYPDVDGRLRPLDMSALADRAVCFIGRDAKGNQDSRLVLTEGECDGLQAAINALDAKQVSEGARAPLKHIQVSGDLQRLLSVGLRLGPVTASGWKAFDSLTGKENNIPKMGLIAWNLEVPTDPLSRSDLGKAGVVIILRTSDPDAVGLNYTASLALVPDK